MSNPSSANSVTTHSSTSKLTISPNSRVDPDLSLIIKNVASPKYRNSSYSKSQFNKHFKLMRIKSIFSTQAGNIIVELFSREDVEKVLREWKPNFFCSEGVPSTPLNIKGTTAIYMPKSTNLTEAIIKKVQKKWTEEEIKVELESAHNSFVSPVNKRFIKRNGDILNTIKVDFKNHDDLIKALEMGVFIHGEHFNVEAFKKQPKAHQCFKCKNFGHPAKWCSRRIRCQYCAEEGHAGTDCIIRWELNEYRCSNCNGQHCSTYSKCPVYVKHLRKPEMTYNTSHD